MFVKQHYLMKGNIVPQFELRMKLTAVCFQRKLSS